MAGAPSVIASGSTTMGVRRTPHRRFAGFPCSGSFQSVRAARLRPAQGLAAHVCTARFASCWHSRRLRRGLARFQPAQVHPRSSHPLRFDIRPHWPQCPPVAALCFAWCRSPLRALRVEPTGLMPSGLRWPTGTAAAVAPPVALRPTRRRLGALVWCGVPGVQSGASRCIWSVACGHSSPSAPAHPRVHAAARRGPARLSHPPPKGAPFTAQTTTASPRALSCYAPPANS